MSGYDDPYAWERKESYLAAIHGDIKPRPVPLCPECLRPMYQKHYEVCAGPPQRIAPPPPAPDRCDCPAGMRHDPDCWLVTGETP